MILDYLNIFAGWPSQAVVIIVSMLPIAELRVGLPLALTAYSLPIWQAFLLAIFGNLLPVWFILKYIGPISSWLSKRSKLFEKFFNWLFERTRRKLNGHYEIYGLWALTLFVAIPLPVTGAWTGAVAAWLFNLPIKKSFLAICLGVMIASGVVFLATTGTVKFLNWIV